MPLYLLPFLLIVVLLALWLFGRSYLTHQIGQGAKEQQAPVTVLDKQAIPSGDNDEYWIYVQHGRFGLKREFQVGIHYFHALNIGDSGMLSYRGNQFIHFAQARPTA
jgi:hypothetical protein